VVEGWQQVDWGSFAIGFWHPFGTHAHEQRDDILKRKAGEIARNGWTLWSFQYRRPEMLAGWREMLRAELAGRNEAFVLCSDSRGTADPRSQPRAAALYRVDAMSAWQPIPAAVRVPHPSARSDRQGCAFWVTGIEEVAAQALPQIGIRWWCSGGAAGRWREDALPTRGEYLIKAGGGAALRPVYAVLRIADPFMVQIRAGADEPTAT
jgi:hypothetical protein